MHKVKWLFVNEYPFLYPERNVTRQFQIETWLDLTELVKELNLKELGQLPKKEENKPILRYVV